MRPPGIDVADFKLKAFFFSLVDAANDWFLALTVRKHSYVGPNAKEVPRQVLPSRSRHSSAEATPRN
ncbi:unnamed protein product [Rhodiola kirilowii]